MNNIQQVSQRQAVAKQATVLHEISSQMTKAANRIQINPVQIQKTMAKCVEEASMYKPAPKRV